MKIIGDISGKIKEELCDAEAYVMLASEVRQDYPDVANAFAKLASEEMGHVDYLHAVVNELITKYRKEHGEPPEAMMTVYNYLHEQQIKKAGAIKAMLEMYRKAA